jgi:class 3 adenylate cyclase
VSPRADVSDDGKEIVVGTIAAFGDPNIIVLDDAGKIALVGHCQQMGIILHAVESVDGSRSLMCDPPIPYSGRGHLSRVWRAAAPRPDTHYVSEIEGVGGIKSNVWLDPSLQPQANEALKNDKSTIRRISSWPIMRCFVYLDVSDFSEHPPGQQALVINSLVELVQDPTLWQTHFAGHLRDLREAMLCIGDGYIYVFSDAVAATCFAAHLANLVEVMVARQSLPVSFHFRIGAHIGPVYSFWDPGRNDWNYIGDGINGGNRVLAAVGKDKDDVVYVSGDMREAIRAARDDQERVRGRHWPSFPLAGRSPVRPRDRHFLNLLPAGESQRFGRGHRDFTGGRSAYPTAASSRARPWPM